MKKTLRDTISSIKKSLKEVTSDSHLTNKFIYSKLISKSAFIIAQSSDKLSLSNVQETYQILKCVDVIEVPAIDPRCTLTSKFSVYRTKNKLPQIYFDSDNAIIRSIRSLDRTGDVELSTLDYIMTIKEDTNSKYDKTIYAWYEEGYLYLTKKIPVKIEGMFVTDISDFQDCDCEFEKENQPCKSFLDGIWYAPNKLQDQIISLLLQDFYNYKKIPSDITTNKSDNN